MDFPHVVGMNYVVKDGAFYMTSYGKAQKVAQRPAQIPRWRC